MAETSQLAKTTFQTGIKDTLAAVDVYTQKSVTSLVNESGLASFDISSIKSLVGGNLGVSALISKYSAAAGITIDAKALTSGIINASPTLRSAFGGMSSGVAASITSVTGPLGAGVSSNISAAIGGISATIKNTNLNDLTSVSAMIGGMSGKSFGINFTDTAGLKTLSVNLLSQANVMGIPNAYAQFALGMTNNQKLLTDITVGITGSVVSTSNVNMLCNMAAGPVAKQINTLAPKFISNFAANFKLSSNTSVGQYAGIALQISGAFTSINPRWNKTTTTSGRTINNANVYLRGSVDFKKVMSAAASYAKNLLAVKPTSTTTYPSGQTPSTPTFPTGTTSSTTVLQDGTSVTTYTMPDGRTYSQATNTDGSTKVDQTYAVQGSTNSPNMTGLPVDHNTIPDFDGEFSYDNPEMENVQRNYTPSRTYPYGTTSSTSTNSDGSVVNFDQTPDGSQFVTTQYSNGVTKSTSVVQDSGQSYSIRYADDPLGGTCKFASSDPMVYGDGVNKLHSAYEDDASNNNGVNLMNSDASEALSYSFPNTQLDNTGDFDQDW